MPIPGECAAIHESGANGFLKTAAQGTFEFFGLYLEQLIKNTTENNTYAEYLTKNHRGGCLAMDYGKKFRASKIVLSAQTFSVLVLIQARTGYST